MSEKLIKKIRTPDGDLQIDYTALANLPMAIKDLGTWDYISNYDTNEEYIETTSTAYASYEEALDDTELETGIYKLEKHYTDVNEGRAYTYIAESSILFVSRGFGYESDGTVIHQILFDNNAIACEDARVHLPRIRRGSTIIDGFWTLWSNDPGADVCDWFAGFEDASHKVSEIDEDDGPQWNEYHYPNVLAVISYVNSKCKSLTERITALETEIAQLKGE